MQRPIEIREINQYEQQKTIDKYLYCLRLHPTMLDPTKKGPTQLYCRVINVEATSITSTNTVKNHCATATAPVHRLPMLLFFSFCDHE